MRRILFSALAFALAPFGANAQYEAVMSRIDDRYDQTADIARKLWEWAEVGYQEERSAGLLMDTLAAHDFEITKGVADIPTAFTAEFGEGGPLIAILAEYDALPGINQDASPTRAPIAGKGAAHACGHNLFGAGSVQAALSIAEWLEESGTPGRIRLYGTPAEEGGSGKVYMVRAGLVRRRRHCASLACG